MIVDQNGIYLSKKQASLTAAILVVLGLLLFIGGYFWGKQSVIDGFTQKTSQESFNDQVDYLLTMQSFVEKNGGAMPEELSKPALSEKESKESKESKVEELLQSLPDAVEETESVSPINTKELTAVQPKAFKHFATLAGFGKKASA